MEQRAGYKHTKLGWIPEEWTIKKLEKLVNAKNGMRRGPFGGSLKKEIFVPKGYKVYEQKNVIYNDFMRGQYYITEDKYNEMEAFQINPNDLLISCSGTIGKIVIFPNNVQKGIINQALLRIRLNIQEMITIYFKYLFESDLMQSKVLDMTHGAAIKNIVSIKELKKILFITPPLPEQKKIAEILSTVDVQITTTDAIIKETKALKQGLMQQLFTRGIGHTRFKKTKIGEVPEDWEIVHFTKYIKINPSYKLESGKEYDFIPMENVHGNFRGIKKYSKRIFGKLSGTKFKNNDIIFAKITPCIENGKVTQITDSVTDFCLGSTEFIIFSTNNENIQSNYLFRYVTSYPFHSKAISIMEGSTGRQRIPKDIFKHFNIPLPPLPEQKEITDIFSEVDKKIELEQNTKEELEQLKKGLMQQLLTGQVRVKV